MNKTSTAIVCVLVCAAPHALAQVGSYLGPGVLSRGAGTIGERAGEQVDLRFYADINAVYDTGIQPFALDSKGNLVTVNGLYGVQADIGAYGTHRWKRALLGLDYHGDFYHYDKASLYDGTAHNLTLGYTYQKSRRLVFDMRELAGTSTLGFGSPGFYGSIVPTNFVDTPSSLLFDNRVYYTQSTLDVNFILSPRTVLTAGGDGFFIHRQAKALAGTNGYNLRGSIQHRLTRTRTVGLTYEHMHFDFPPAFGESDVNLAQAFFSNALGRRWTLSISAGAFQTEVQGVEQVALNPVIAALLGTGYTQRAFYRENIFPAGRVALTGQYHRTSIGLSVDDGVAPGNGVYLTSRQLSAGGNISYTATRKWTFGVNGGYMTLGGIGQNLTPYSTYFGGANSSYTLTRSLHAVARFDSRNQQIDVVGFKRNAYRATIGLAFSPGDIPLSLW